MHGRRDPLHKLDASVGGQVRPWLPRGRRASHADIGTRP